MSCSIQNLFSGWFTSSEPQSLEQWREENSEEIKKRRWSFLDKNRISETRLAICATIIAILVVAIFFTSGFLVGYYLM